MKAQVALKERSLCSLGFAEVRSSSRVLLSTLLSLAVHAQLRVRGDGAGGYTPLVNIQTCAAFVDNVHLIHPLKQWTGDGCPAWVKFFRTCFPIGSDRQWCLWGMRDHTGGQARSASIKPISGVAPALLAFYSFSCALARPGA